MVFPSNLMIEYKSNTERVMFYEIEPCMEGSRSLTLRKINFGGIRMKNQISIREATTESDIAAFWEQLRLYFKRDIFPNPEDEEREYFLSDTEYRKNIQDIHDRLEDPCYYLFFQREGQDIGFAMPAIYRTEDGKCFILEFCVYPKFRGNGTGRECARVLLDWAKRHGALYAELNYGGTDCRRRFWESAGFVENGIDEWGEPLMILPPDENVPIVIETLSAPEDWQLMKLENGYQKEIGGQALTEQKQEHLKQAIRDGKIVFFVAKRGYRAVGICSVAKCFSTCTYSDTAIFQDFYIEPVFRKKGIAQKLAQAAQAWCKEHGVASLYACCAPCDERMCQALGFGTRLGTAFAHLC
jgi:GNAT superfamily N-acetyltransferase